MFGLFELFGLFKKPEEENQNWEGSTAQFKAFSSQFLPQEIDIQAVTGASDFNGGRAGKKELWMASTTLTAWRDEESPEIHQGKFSLISLGDEQLLNTLRRRAPRNCVIKFRGRVSTDGTCLLLLALPEFGTDLDMRLILRDQKRPLTFWEEGLGTFTLNREVGWFTLDVDWLGTPAYVVFDQNENQDDCVSTIKTLLANMAGWDKRVRECAADALLSLANDWAEGIENEYGESGPITREEFMERMGMDTVAVREGGSFDFWFMDGGMFYGHSIHISGDLENGLSGAVMEV